MDKRISDTDSKYVFINVNDPQNTIYLQNGHIGCFMNP